MLEQVLDKGRGACVAQIELIASEYVVSNMEFMINF